jgi:putative DNA primase/helicase
MRPDGTVLTDPGYDGASRLFYQPAPGVLFPPVPESPTLDDARVALRALHEPFVDFPFRDAASTSTALALVLTVLGRGAFSGASPLFLIRATNAGTGKQLLAELVSTIATGGPPPTFAAPREDAEWEKKLVAHVREGDRFTVIDEAKHLDSPVLAHAVTQEFLTGRILGLSENVRGRVPVLASCGNQTTFAHDFGRRVLPIDLDAKRSDPERRSGFSIANVSAWCLRERTRLVVAALTSLRAYVLAGRPDQSLCSMGSFEGWSGLIRSTLVWSGLTDPLEGQDRARAESDVGADANLMLLRAWHEATHEPMTSWQIADIANLRGAAGLVHPKLHALLLALDDRQKDTLKPERLGYAFRRLRNKIVANLVLRGVAQDDGDHRIHWQVEKLVLTEAKNKPGALEFSSPGAWDSGRE